MSGNGLSRRHFFLGPLLAGAVPAGGFASTPSLKLAGYKTLNEKLNIASVGAGGEAAIDIRACAPGENITALCDVDDKRAASIFNQFPNAVKYKDFRKMLDKEDKNIDAVIVTIPDFMHATIATWCMERGKHVYVQKPLTRTVWEARWLAETAAKYKVATQMGNQGYSCEGARQCSEMIWAGEIGNVTEVHAYTDRPIWPQDLTKIPPEDPVPATLDWDLWLGIANARPYTVGGPGYPTSDGNFYQPFNWRGFHDFGSGALGDMACHLLGAPHMALRLGAPTSVECIQKEGTSGFMFPKKAVIRFDFPARGGMPPVKIFWYDGLKEQPKLPGVPDGELLGDLPRPPRVQGQAAPPPAPTGFQGEVFTWSDSYLPTAPRSARGIAPNGCLFVGDKGMITCGARGEIARLVPVERMRGYKFPTPTLTRSPGHYRDWIRACKGGDPACSNFSVSGPFAEYVQLGSLSLRFPGKLEWDSAKMLVTNVPEANKYLKPTFRKGWTLT